MKPFGPVTQHVDQEGIDAYAELSGDFNPLHVDPEVAARSEFGGTIAHGPVGMHAFFRASTGWLGSEALPPGTTVKVVYRAPTRPGDDVTCRLLEMSRAEKGQVALEAECVTQDGTGVVSVRAQMPAPGELRDKEAEAG